MKPDLITSQYTESQHQEKREQFLKREKLEPMFLNVNGKSKVTPFKRGDRLNPELSMAPALGDWSPAGKADLTNIVNPKLLAKVEAEWRAEGLAGFIASSDTAGGITESIEYDPDEQEIISIIESQIKEEPSND